MSGLRTRLEAATGGAATTPLLLLFCLNLVDEFDRIAFGVLTPEIRDAFDLSDAGIVAVGSAAAVISLVGALPIGWLVDRRGRTGMLRVVGGLWAAMAVLTGLSPVLLVLVLARVGAGLAHVSSEPLHASLLGDWYAPKAHPRVFALHRLANPLSAIIAVPLGLSAVVWGWRPVFLLIAAPTLVLAVLTGRLREPARGASIDAALADLVAEDDPVSFGEARRQLFAIKTLRRLWIGSFFLGAAVVPIGQLLSLFFEEAYGYGADGRGVVSFVLGAASIVGIAVGDRLAGDAARSDRAERLPVVVGLSFSALGVGLLLMAVAPWSVASLTFAFLGVIGLGSFQPAYYSLVGLVSPPRVRGQAYAWALVIVGLGGLTSAIVAGVGDATSYRTAIGGLSVLIVVFGLVQTTARHFVRRDVDEATRTLAVALAVRSATAGDELLVCRGLEVAYDDVQVLFGVDLVVRRGEVLALLGTNGAGKSTVLRAICGLVDPIGGAVFFDGRDITHADAGQTAGAGISLVPGGKGVFPMMTVDEHLRLAGSRVAAPAADLAARTEELFEAFPRLRERRSQLAGNMSGGEQQMLAVGLAFLARPRLLLIDELSLGLAPAIVEELLRFVRRLTAGGTTVVLVEQSVNVALTVADRTYFLEKGEVRFCGPTAELLERDDVLRAVFLPGGGGGGGGRSSAATPAVAPRAPKVEGPPALAVSGLTRSFGGITAVDDVSFVVEPGEILGLIGSNGAGKTTIFDLVSGFLPAEAGSITLGGLDVTGWSPDRRARAGLGRSFQDARIFPSLTVAENIAVALERHLLVRDMASDALALPAVRDVEADVWFTVDALVGALGLEAYRDKAVSELSTGSRRIVDLAMVMSHRPSVVLFDEPSSGIAQREAEALGPLLRRLRDETGCAVLVIEHDMPLVTAIADRMVALEMGAVIAEGTPAEVVGDDRVIASYLGGDARLVQRSGARRVGEKVGART